MHLHVSALDFAVFIAMWLILKLAVLLATTHLDADNPLAKALSVLG